MRLNKEELMEKSVSELEILDGEYYDMWQLVKKVKEFKKL